MKKKVAVGVGILILILAVILGIVLLLSARKEAVESGDSTSRYPYTFLSGRDGLQITITGGEEGYLWKVIEGDYAVAYPLPQKSKKGTSSFLFKPMQDGECRVVLALTDTENLADSAYRIHMNLIVKDGKVQLGSCGHKERNQVLYGENNRYTITEQNDGTWLVCMQAAEGADWMFRAESGEIIGYPYMTDDLAAASVFTRKETVDNAGAEPKTDGKRELSLPAFFIVSVTGDTPGSALIYDRGRGEALELHMENRQDEGNVILSHGLVPYREEVEDSELPVKESDRHWQLPDSAEILYSGKSVISSVPSVPEADWCFFSSDGVRWVLWCSDRMTRDEMAGPYYENSEEGKETDGILQYRWEGKLNAAWNGKDGCGYLLLGETDDWDALYALACALNEEIQP